MPSSMTHTYFGLDVYKELPQTCKNKIKNKIEYFKLFCQGSDPFMFYHFLLGKKAKDIMLIQKTMHTSKTQDFFINTIEYIQEHNLLNNQEVMSYLYGYICHYYLDLNTHPLIYYKSGKFDKKNKETYKYNGLHQELEYNIDLYMIKTREKEKPHKFKVYQNIFNVSTFSPELKKAIEQTINKTYGFKNISKTYLSSIRYMKLFFKYANHDPYKIKLKIYQIIDKVTPKSTIKLEKLSYHHEFENNLSCLNLEHKLWNYPWDKFQTSTLSFFDLYNIALKDSIKTISLVTEMLEKEKIDKKELERTFPNLSFSTGKPCQEKIKIKYFES